MRQGRPVSPRKVAAASGVCPTWTAARLREELFSIVQLRSETASARTESEIGGSRFSNVEIDSHHRTVAAAFPE